MHESDERDPRDVFGDLGAGEPGEIDSRRMWRRLEDALPTAARDRSAAASAGSPVVAPAWRALAAAAIVVVTVAVWAGVAGLRYEPAEPPLAPPGDPAAGELVLLAPPAELAPATPGDVDPAVTLPAVPLDERASASRPRFDIRLVMGYEGPPPANALSATAEGAGAVDRLVDVDATLRAVLPQERFALVGQWSGAAETGEVSRLRLSARYVVEFTAEADPDTGAVTLRNMRLITDGRSDSTSSVALQPGALYLFGAAATPSEAAGSSLALAIRLIDAPQ